MGVSRTHPRLRRLPAAEALALPRRVGVGKPPRDVIVDRRNGDTARSAIPIGRQLAAAHQAVQPDIPIESKRQASRGGTASGATFICAEGTDGVGELVDDNGVDADIGDIPLLGDPGGNHRRQVGSYSRMRRDAGRQSIDRLLCLSEGPRGRPALLVRGVAGAPSCGRGVARSRRCGLAGGIRC